MSDPDRELAETLLRARDERRCLTPGTGQAAVTDERAYRVQDELTALRLARGQRIIGWKLGYTSEAMRTQMGIAEPNLGPLTDAMIVRSGDAVPSSVIHPKVEPEIALVLGCDVATALDVADVAACLAEARAALEVVDSIWQDYRFTWADNTADGSSAAHVVLGPTIDDADLASVTVVLRRNGAEVGSGVGANAMGDPLAALSWLTARLAERGQRLRAGEFVITGGLCPAVDLRPGDQVSAVFGSVEVEVSRPATARNTADPGGRLVE